MKPDEPLEECPRPTGELAFDTFRYVDIHELKYLSIFFNLLPIALGFGYGIACHRLIVRFDEFFVGIVTLILVLLAAFFYSLWLYHACSNAHALGATGLTFSPGWAVGCYFVPLLNLLLPYFALQEIWKASTSPNDWQAQPDSPVIRWYWLATVGGMVMVGIAGLMRTTVSIDPETAILQPAAWFFLAAFIVPIMAVVLQCAVVAAITNRQILTVEGPRQSAIAATVEKTPNPLE